MLSKDAIYFDSPVIELLSTTMYSPVCYFTGGGVGGERIMVSALKVDRPDFYFLNTLPSARVQGGGLFYSVPADGVIDFINMYKNQRVSVLKLYNTEELVDKIEKTLSIEP